MSNFLNVTLEDNSPSIIYTGAWDGDEHKGDTKVPEYSNANSHATRTQSDSLLFSWTGGPIWLYGAKRPNHGHFSVSLDGAEKVFKSGFAPSDQWKALLWSSGDLQEGKHEVVVVNERGHAQTDEALAWFDLDFIKVQADPEQFSVAPDQSRGKDQDSGTEQRPGDITYRADTFITTGQPKVRMILPTGVPEIIRISSASPSRSIAIGANLSAESRTRRDAAAARSKADSDPRFRPEADRREAEAVRVDAELQRIRRAEEQERHAAETAERKFGTLDLDGEIRHAEKQRKEAEALEAKRAEERPKEEEKAVKKRSIELQRSAPHCTPMPHAMRGFNDLPDELIKQIIEENNRKYAWMRVNRRTCEIAGPILYKAALEIEDDEESEYTYCKSGRKEMDILWNDPEPSKNTISRDCSMV
ncbi:hypothetical protein IAT40_001900 [Kwoniella sp. CBS 6097]